jgi:tetratricopeptide (TPR) repeat protein
MMVLSPVASQVWAASGEAEGQKQAIKRASYTLEIFARRRVDELTQPYGEDNSPATREKIARTLLKVGREMSKGGIHELSSGISYKGKWESAFYNEVTRRFGADKLPAVRAMVAEMLLLKGIVTRTGSHPKVKAGIPVFEEFELRFGQDKDPAIRALYVRSLVEKGIAWAGENPEMAVAIYDDVVSRYGEDRDPVVRAQAASALLQKASAVKDRVSFLNSLDEIDRRYGKDKDPEVQQRVIEMLFRKARITGWPEGKEEDDQRALAAYDEINRRFGKGNVQIQTKIAQELIFKGLYEQVVRMFGEGAEIPGAVVWALMLMGDRLQGKGDFKAALAAYDEADRRYGESSAVAEVLEKKGRLLEQQGDLGAALAVYEDIGLRFGRTNNIEAALSLVRKGEILEKQGKLMEAIALFDEVEQRFGENEVVIGRGFVSEAIKLRTAIRARLSGQ